MRVSVLPRSVETVVVGAGIPRQTDGLTEVPGLAFLGLPWMRDMGSATLFGVGLDAEVLAERMESARQAS